MAEDQNINGASAEDVEDPAAESFHDAREAETARASDLNRKILTLEHEKSELVEENNQIRQRVEELTAEIEEWRREEAVIKEKVQEMTKEVERGEEERRALESMAGRCAELEAQVVGLQHDLITSMTDVEDSNVELSQLKKALSEKGDKLEALEREIEELRSSKAESEKRVRELERKIGVLEVREIEEKSRKVRIEEEMREKIGEKDAEILGLKRKVEEMEALLAKNGAELDKWASEKSSVEAKLMESQERTRNLESKMAQLQREAEEAEKLIGGLKERSMVDGVNGDLSRVTIAGGDKGLRSQWPVLAVGSTGAIAAAAAVVYVFCYGKRR